MAYNFREEDYLVYEWKDFRQAIHRISDSNVRQMVRSAWKAFEDSYATLKTNKGEEPNPAYIVISADDPKAAEILAILERKG